MNIRAYHPDDLEALQEIYDLHYATTIDFPNFLRYICAVVIEEDGKIITAGGIRPIAECTALTDLNLDPRVRIRALHELLQASIHVCKQTNFDQIYVWSQNTKYSRRMMRNRFRPAPGQSLILDLE